MNRIYLSVMALGSILVLNSGGYAANRAQKENPKPGLFIGAKGEVKLITLDPGHFHAALVQKNKYDQISSEVYVYAPAGNDLNEHLKRIEGYNKRAETPTAWDEKVYTGDDYLEKMVSEKRGNVVVVSGNNLSLIHISEPTRPY